MVAQNLDKYWDDRIKLYDKGSAYVGTYGGVIYEGPYRNFVINKQLLPGFDLLAQNKDEQAFNFWKNMSDKGHFGASVNIARLYQTGEG